MTIIFEKIIPTKNQSEKLFSLLLNRKYSISHKKFPSQKEHNEFVMNNPYIDWLLIYKDKNLLGSVYVQLDNSIGINLNEPNKDDVLEVINYIKYNYLPSSQIKSMRSGDFFLNIASDNSTMIQILNELNKKEIQRSFLI